MCLMCCCFLLFLKLLCVLSVSVSVLLLCL